MIAVDHGCGNILIKAAYLMTLCHSDGGTVHQRGAH